MISSKCPGCRFRRSFVNRIKLSDRLKLCDVADVTKVAACGPGRSGRVGEIGGSTYAMPHNLMWFTQLLLN